MHYGDTSLDEVQDSNEEEAYHIYENMGPTLSSFKNLNLRGRKIMILDEDDPNFVLNLVDPSIDVMRNRMDRALVASMKGKSKISRSPMVNDSKLLVKKRKVTHMVFG